MLDNAAIRRRIGERLQRARGPRSRREVATALGVTTQTVWNWETGVASPAPERQREIAAELGATWSDLFTLDDEAVA